MGRSPRAVIVERAQAAGLDASTLYRWARAYRASGLLSSLLPSPQSRSSTLLRSGNDGTREGAGETALRSTRSSVSMSRANDKVEADELHNLMKRRPPHST